MNRMTEVNLEISLMRSLDHTVVAEIAALPGVLAAARDSRAAVRAIKALALRVLAERIEMGELAATDLSVTFSVSVGGRMLLAEDELADAVSKAVSPEVRETVAEQVFDPLQNALGGVPGAIAEALGRPRPQARRAADVLTVLETAGWIEHRRASTHRTLRNVQGRELVFSFRDDDVLTNELLHRLGALGGVTF